jgi:hypothetical protein
MDLGSATNVQYILSSKASASAVPMQLKTEKRFEANTSLLRHIHDVMQSRNSMMHDASSIRDTMTPK